MVDVSISHEAVLAKRDIPVVGSQRRRQRCQVTGQPSVLIFATDIFKARKAHGMERRTKPEADVIDGRNCYGESMENLWLIYGSYCRHLCFKAWFLLIHQSLGVVSSFWPIFGYLQNIPIRKHTCSPWKSVFLSVSPCFQFLNHYFSSFFISFSPFFIIFTIKIQFFTIFHHFSSSRPGG